MLTIVARDDVYILNYCTKSLARDNADARHDYGQYAAGDPRARIAEAWRFPVVDSYYDGRSYADSYAFNTVTLVYVNADGSAREVGVIGTFADLVAPIAMPPVGDSVYHAVSVAVPKGQVHTYRFVIDGRSSLDPVNPQRVVHPDGTAWSRFFTQYCTEIISFERWEVALLTRLTDHILPFRTTEGQRFLDLYYNDKVDRQTKDTQYARAYRLDQPVGVVNFIDKIVAREESHRLADYKICLDLIDRVLRKRDPYEEPAQMPATLFADLYAEMATDRVADWDTSRYGSPRFFLQLLRRHAYTGAFSHPKYGGNAGAAGWAYLAHNLRDPATHQLPPADDEATAFDWSRALEPPLGRNPEYHG